MQSKPINKFWKKDVARRKYMEWLGNELGFTSMEDWYKISAHDFSLFGGRGLIANYYEDSPVLAVQSIFKNHNWETFKFHYVPRGHWVDLENQRKFVEFIGNEGEFKTLDDWYKITTEDFFKYGGGGLLNGYYNGSPAKCIMNVFPDKPWQSWLFSGQKIDVKSENYQKWLLGSVKELTLKLNITYPEQWLLVGKEVVLKNIPFGSRMLRQNGGLLNILKVAASPSNLWKKENFSHSRKKSTQNLLALFVQELCCDRGIFSSVGSNSLY